MWRSLDFNSILCNVNEGQFRSSLLLTHIKQDTKPIRVNVLLLWRQVGLSWGKPAQEMTHLMILHSSNFFFGCIF